MKPIQQSGEAKAPFLVASVESSSIAGRVKQLWLRIRFHSIVGTVGTQMGMFGLHAVHSVILARLLGPHGRGEYGTAVLFTQIFMYSGMLGTSFSIARRAGNAASDLGALGKASIRVGFVTGLLSLSVVCLLALTALPEAKRYLITLCILNGLLLPFEHARLALLSVDHGSGEFRRYNINRLTAAVLFPILLVLVWWLGLVSVATVTALSVLTTIISLGALLQAHHQTLKSKAADPSLKVLLKEGVPYGTSYFAGQLLGRIDTILVLWIMNFTDQGYYAVALAASGLMQVLPNALSLYSFNLGASNHGKLPTRRILFAGAFMMTIQIFSAIVMAFVLIYFLPLIFGEKFIQATPFALALLPGLAIEGIATISEGYLRGCGRPLSTLLPRTLGAIILIVGVYFLYPVWGALSIPIASSLGYSLSGGAILGLVVWYQLRSLHKNEH